METQIVQALQDFVRTLDLSKNREPLKGLSKEYNLIHSVSVLRI